jgi:peptidylprolyl isomerase
LFDDPFDDPFDEPFEDEPLLLEEPFDDPFDDDDPLLVHAPSDNTNTANRATSARRTSPNVSPMKPDVSIPDTPAPAELLIEDITVGDGDEAKPGDNVCVHYVGVSYSNGKQFDASWDRDETFEFRVGAGQVISGWDRGVAGMKVGGQRRLTIPPDLGYGSQGAGGVIGPNETLVFVVDLVSVRP